MEAFSLYNELWYAFAFLGLNMVRCLALQSLDMYKLPCARGVFTRSFGGNVLVHFRRICTCPLSVCVRNVHAHYWCTIEKYT